MPSTDYMSTAKIPQKMLLGTASGNWGVSWIRSTRGGRRNDGREGRFP